MSASLPIIVMPSYSGLGSGRKCCSTNTSSGDSDGDSDRDGIVGSIVLAFHTQITTSKEKHVLV